MICTRLFVVCCIRQTCRLVHNTISEYHTIILVVNDTRVDYMVAKILYVLTFAGSLTLNDLLN